MKYAPIPVLQYQSILRCADFLHLLPICPECGEKAIEYLYVGDKNTGIGYLPIWCNKCKQGIQLSRVGIPEGAKKISINDTDSIRKNIPNFNQVYPTD